MGLGSPPLQVNIMLESNPLKSIMLVGRLGVTCAAEGCTKIAMSGKGEARARGEAIGWL